LNLNFPSNFSSTVLVKANLNGSVGSNSGLKLKDLTRNSSPHSIICLKIILFKSCKVEFAISQLLSLTRSSSTQLSEIAKAFSWNPLKRLKPISNLIA
jgi:hypothetical protein